MRRGTFFILCLVVAVPVSGQEQTCQLVRTGGGGTTIGTEGNTVSFLGGGVSFRCPNGVTILSDSVAFYEAASMAEFVGHVRFTDPENRLTAGYVRYLGKERKAIAQTDVVLTDRETGSTIRAPGMDYYQRSDERPEPLIQMFNGRPHAVLVSIPAADSVRRDTTIVDADAMDITGRTRFAARGNVELQQGDMRGYGQSGEMDREAGRLRLTVKARLEGADYQLQGDTIVAETTDTEDLREVTAIRDARLNAADVDVDARSIRVFFEEGEVNRLVARGETPDTGATDMRRQASAVSVDFQLTADSLDVIAPGRQLDTVKAVGRALGQRLGEDLGDATVPTIAAHDWMRGDTILATFRAAELTPDDTASQPKRELDTVTSLGNPATSAYRIADEQDSTAVPGINYLRAGRILVSMLEGKVSTVEAEGDVQGVYLQPVRRGEVATDAGKGAR
jgi:lipopolysaccharide export system protein LptA